MAAATALRTTLTPTEQAMLIRRRFSALLPFYDETLCQWIAPSQTERGVKYPTMLHRLATGEMERRCPCKATGTCTHLILIEQLSEGALKPDERIIDHTPLTASYDAKYDRFMRSGYGAGGLS